MSPQPTPLRIAIVGGGIAGLSSALALQRFQKEGANIKIKIYEQAVKLLEIIFCVKAADDHISLKPKFAEIGAGLAFGPNAQRALEVIGVSEALNRVSQNASLDPDLWYTFKVGEAKHPSTGKVITTVKGINASRGTVHRADFLDEMIALVHKESSMFDHTCCSYTPHANGVTLHFTNKPDAEADVIIASDGVKSRLRAHLYHRRGLNVESQMARYSEWVAWRGLIPVSAFKKAMGHNCSYKQMLLGHDRHILHFPVRNGEVINIVGFVRDPEHRKLGGHVGPWAEKRPAAEMLEDFKSFTSDCLDMLKAIQEPSIWGIFTVPELETSIDDRIALIGDACHAMTPHQGAGAGQAIEDALFLSAILSSPDVCRSDKSTRKKMIDEALATYQRVRHKRGREVQKTSREAGLLYQFRGVNGEGDDLGKIGRNLEHRMGWIWEWDIKKELAAALGSGGTKHNL